MIKNNNSKKIVHVISSLKRGGAETVLVSLLTHPLFEKYEHHVIFFHDGPLRKSLQKNNITLYHISYGQLFFFRLLYRIYCVRPDVIHASLWFAMVNSCFIGWLLRIPTLIVFHNNIDQNASYKNWCDWFVLRLASRYVAVSQYVAQSVHCYHAWLSLESIEIIHNGIDMPARVTTVEELRQKFFLPIDAVIIGTVGRFEKVKRIPWLIDRFVQLRTVYPHLYLMLIGTGSQESMLRDYVIKKDIAQYVRFVVDQDAYNFYPFFDIFALTSEKEGISIALLEAMSYAKACIVTNDSLKHPVIDNGYNGYVVQADDADMFVKKLTHLITSFEQRALIGKNALSTVSTKFLRNVMAQQYVQKIEFLLKL